MTESHTSRTIIIVVVLCGISLALMLIPLSVWVIGPNYEYGVVMDAGSTGTRIHVYMWEHPTNETDSPQVLEAPTYGESKWSIQINPGISSFASDPAGAGRSIQPLLEFALQHVPSRKQAFTPIFLFATAGMRLVVDRSPVEAEAILDSVRSAINATSFRITDLERQVRVITGQEEALFGWVTVNTALGVLGISHSVYDTVGTLDMGGASTQIAFIPEGTPSAVDPDYVTVYLMGRSYTLFAVSFLGFGVNSAIDRFNQSLASVAGGVMYDPCVQAGYSERIARGVLLGSGNYSECSSLMPSVVLNITKPGDRVNDVVIPPLRGDFYGFSGFPYAMNFFGLPEKPTVHELEAAAHRYCSLSWTEVLGTYTDPAVRAFLSTYCFNGAYYSSLLSTGYGFDRDSRQIDFTQTVNNIETGWALGAMTYEAGLLPWFSPVVDPPLPVMLVFTPMGVAVEGLALCLMVAAVIVLCCARREETTSYETV